MNDSPNLQLMPQCWYGWQMIPGYAGERNVPYCSPILVQCVTPKHTGKRILNLSFINVLYTEGVQHFKLDLRILKHESAYLVAELLYGDAGLKNRTAVISHIEFEWVRRYCPELWYWRPPSACSGPAQTSISLYLDEVFKGSSCES